MYIHCTHYTYTAYIQYKYISLSTAKNTRYECVLKYVYIIDIWIWRVTWDTTKHDFDLICFCCFCGIARVENWKYVLCLSLVCLVFELQNKAKKQAWHTFSHTLLRIQKTKTILFSTESTLKMSKQYILIHIIVCIRARIN